MLRRAAPYYMMQMKRSLSLYPYQLKSSIKKLHAGTEQNLQAIDYLLGFDYLQIEKKISPMSYGYNIGHFYQKNALMTEYKVLQNLFNHLKLSPKDVVYDLGSGYGRFLFYGASLYPDIKFKGVEIVNERAEETVAITKKGQFGNITIINKDVLNTDLSEGTVFYMFNPFKEIIFTVMETLRKVARKHDVTIVAYHQNTLEDLNKISWLTQKECWPKYATCIYKMKP